MVQAWSTVSALVRHQLKPGGPSSYSIFLLCGRSACIEHIGSPPSTAASFLRGQTNIYSRRFYKVGRNYNVCDKKRDPLAMANPGVSKGQRSRIGFGGYFQLMIPITTFCLGVWQVYRWFWKLDLIEEMERRTSTVLPFSSLNLEHLEDYEYNTVTVRGSFLPGIQLLLGPRALHDSSSGKKHSVSGGFISQGSQSGYNIITPFKVAGQDTILLVNRGWIPHKNIEKYRIDPSAKEEVEIAGILRKGEKRPQFMTKTLPGSMLWFYRDVESMASLLGTSEIFLDLISIGEDADKFSGRASSQSKLENYPIPGQTRITLRNEHVGYFITWFSLSAITSYLWFRQFKLRLPLK